MGRKQISAPNLSKPSLTGDWWEGVRGRVKFMGERIPLKFNEVSRRSEQLGVLTRGSNGSEVSIQRKLSEMSIGSRSSQVYLDTKRLHSFFLIF